MKSQILDIRTLPSFGQTVARPREDKTARRMMICAMAALAVTPVLAVTSAHAMDYGMVEYMNSFAHRWAVLDGGVVALTREMFSNLLLMTMVWYLWFESEDREMRAGLLAGTVVSLLGGAASRVLQLALPMHPRPLHDAALAFRIPFGVQPDALNHWSSFPSDHATVLFGLATVIVLAKRSLAWPAFAVAFIANAARVYLGYHFPSDVLGGAALGVLLVSATYGMRHSQRLMRWANPVIQRRPMFYAAAFFLCFGMTTLFEDLRIVVTDVAKVARTHVHSRVS